MIHMRAQIDRPELAAPAHKRLNEIPTLSHEARLGAVISPRRQRKEIEEEEKELANGVKAQRPKTAKPTFHPQISEGTKQILD